MVMKNFFALSKLVGFGLFLLVPLGLASGCSKNEEKGPPAAYSAAEREKSPETVLEQALKETKANPNNPATLYHLGDIYDRQGQYQKSVEIFQKVIELQPDKGYAYLKMGTGYSQLNQPEKAAEALRQAIRYLPELPLAYNNLAIAYGKLGKLDEEVANLQKALQLRPRYGSARYNLGMTYLKKSEPEKARQEYEQLKEYDGKLATELLLAIENRK